MNYLDPRKCLILSWVHFNKSFIIVTILKLRILLQAYLEVSFEISLSSYRETFFRLQFKFTR